MAIDNALFDTWKPRALAVLRVVTAYLFIPHGTAKLFGAPHQAMFDELQLMSPMGLAGILEVVGGALILIGLFTRPVAFVLCGFMAVAYQRGLRLPFFIMEHLGGTLTELKVPADLVAQAAAVAESTRNDVLGR